MKIIENEEETQDVLEYMRSISNIPKYVPMETTLVEWCVYWLQTRACNIKESTRSSYEHVIKNHIKRVFGKMKLEEVTSDDVQLFINSLIIGYQLSEPLSPKTIKNIHGVLSKALSVAVQQQYIPFNAAKGVVLPNIERKPPNPLTDSQLIKFYDRIKAHEKGDIFKFVLLTGLRESEIIGLTVNCFDRDNKTLCVYRQLVYNNSKKKYEFTSLKNSRSRVLSLSQQAFDILDKYCPNSLSANTEVFIFQNRKGSHFTPAALYNSFKKVVKSIGLPKVTFHDLRHTHAVLSLKAGMDIKTLQYNLGHYSAAFTVEDKSKVVKKKSKSTRTIILVSCICALLAGGAGIGGGYYLFNKYKNTPIFEPETAPVSEDGMIIPEQDDIESDVEQITVSIDRSYSAVPTEDLELKGAIVDGKATIQLPEFDKTDFFTHVAGYTWGFTTVPDGKKIEYYGGQSYEFTENTKLYRVLVKYGGGSGTKEDPYLIDYYDQLELMATEKARGYFKQTADIIFPDYASHTSIDTVNELKNDPSSEYFEYDGNGYIIEKIDKPLFGKVSGATIKNVNIRNAVIESNVYHDYGAIVCNAYNYHYKTNTRSYETGETLIKHCTVSHCSIILGEEVEETSEVQSVTGEVVPPDVIEYDENGKVIEHTDNEEVVAEKVTKKSEGYSIGGISGNGGQIEDCYVEDFGVTVNSEEYITNVGGISGKPANVLNSGVFTYSINGNVFNAGGIVGSASGTRAYDASGKELPEYYGGNIQGCVARRVWFNNELSAGGIAAVGGSDAENPMISNCYAMELYFNCGEYADKVKKTGFTEGICGGILGCDGTSKHGHLITNTVSVADKLVIGSKSKSSFDKTVRQAPDYAFYQENILTVINSNTVNPADPKEIYTGVFKFGGSEIFGDSESGSLSYPESIEDLFAKTITEGQ